MRDCSFLGIYHITRTKNLNSNLNNLIKGLRFQYGIVVWLITCSWLTTLPPLSFGNVLDMKWIGAELKAKCVSMLANYKVSCWWVVVYFFRTKRLIFILNDSGACWNMYRILSLLIMLHKARETDIENNYITRWKTTIALGLT